jgi:hypothetical protein
MEVWWVQPSVLFGQSQMFLTHWAPSELHSITTRRQHSSVTSVRILGITSQWGYVLPCYLFNFLPSVLFNFPFPFSSHTQTHTYSDYSCSSDQVFLALHKLPPLSLLLAILHNITNTTLMCFWSLYKLPPLSLLPAIPHNYITNTTLMC